MRPRPTIVSLAFLVLAFMHARWGVQTLLDGAAFLAASQVVSAGAFVLAAGGARSRTTVATGLAIAAAATSARVLYGLSNLSPFTAATFVLTLGLAAAAFGARRLDEPEAPGWAPLALRGGFAAMAVAYAGFLSLTLAFNGPPTAVPDLALRVAASVALAVFVDAPPARLRDERKAFGGEPSSASR